MLRGILHRFKLARSTCIFLIVVGLILVTVACGPARETVQDVVDTGQDGQAVSAGAAELQDTGGSTVEGKPDSRPSSVPEVGSRVGNHVPEFRFALLLQSSIDIESSPDMWGLRLSADASIAGDKRAQLLAAQIVNVKKRSTKLEGLQGGQDGRRSDLAHLIDDDRSARNAIPFSELNRVVNAGGEGVSLG